jgi:hypothetical protein
MYDKYEPWGEGRKQTKKKKKYEYDSKDKITKQNAPVIWKLRAGRTKTKSKTGDAKYQAKEGIQPLLPQHTSPAMAMPSPSIDFGSQGLSRWWWLTSVSRHLCYFR